MVKSWQELPLATKCGIIFAFLLVLTIIAGLIRLMLNRRHVKKHKEQSQLRVDRKRLDSKDTVRELGEGDLFGVRALEAGHYGGVAQSRPASPTGFRTANPATEPLPRSMPHTRASSHHTVTRFNNNGSPAPFERALAKAVENQIGVARSTSARVSAGTYNPSTHGPGVDMSLEFPPSPKVFPIRPDSPYWQVSKKEGGAASIRSVSTQKQGGAGSIRSIAMSKPQITTQAKAAEPQEFALPPPQLVITTDRRSTGSARLHLRSPSTIVIPTEGTLKVKSEAASIVSGSQNGSEKKSNSGEPDSPLSFVGSPVNHSPPISPSHFPAVPSSNDSKTDISFIPTADVQPGNFDDHVIHEPRGEKDIYDKALSTNDWGLGHGHHSRNISESGSSVYSRSSVRREEAIQQEAIQRDIEAAMLSASWTIGPIPTGTYLDLTPPPSRPESAADAPPNRQSNVHLSLHFGGEWNPHLSQQFGEFYDAYYRRSQSTQGRQSIIQPFRQSTQSKQGERQLSHYRNPSQQSHYHYRNQSQQSSLLHSRNTSPQAHAQAHSRNTSQSQSHSHSHSRNQSQSQPTTQPHTLPSQSQNRHLGLAEYTIVEVPTPMHSPLRFEHQRTYSGRVI